MPNRRSPEDQLADLERKERQLKARIQKKKAELRTHTRRQDTRRKIIAGALALEHAQQDPDFGATLNRLLRSSVKRPEDRALFGLKPLPDTAAEGGAGTGTGADAKAEPGPDRWNKIFGKQAQ